MMIVHKIEYFLFTLDLNNIKEEFLNNMISQIKKNNNYLMPAPI